MPIELKNSLKQVLYGPLRTSHKSNMLCLGNTSRRGHSQWMVSDYNIQLLPNIRSMCFFSPISEPILTHNIRLPLSHFQTFFRAAYIWVRQKKRLVTSAKRGSERSWLECKGSLQRPSACKEILVHVKMWREKIVGIHKGSIRVIGVNGCVLLKCNVKVLLASVLDVCYYWVISRASVSCPNTRQPLGTTRFPAWLKLELNQGFDLHQ